MRFVGRISAQRFCLPLVLAACAPEGLFADEPLPAPSVSPKDADLVATTAARRVWSILAAIEQSHVAAPTRTELARAIAVTLCWPDEFSSSDAVGDEFGRCRDADEFVALFARRWREERRPTGSIKQLAETVVKTLEDGGKWGHFRLWTKKEYAVQEQFRGNRYVGLGVGLARNESGDALFSFIVPGGPAQRFGIEAGTLIMEVNGHSTKDEPLEAITGWVRGPVGTDVKLKIADRGRGTNRVVTLQRGFVRFDTVSGFGQRGLNFKPLDSDSIRFHDDLEIGYLNFRDITGSTLQELRDAEVLLRKAKVRAVVLDFRNGARIDTFHQARLVADGLLDGGTLWHWHERDAAPRTEMADRECLFRGLPLVVAVDKDTSGPQAAIAAALQDAGRAVIVGTSPAYDGLVTTGVELADGEHFLEMGTAKIVRSRADHQWPLMPDFEAPVLAIQPDGSIDEPALTVTKPASPNQPPPRVVIRTPPSPTQDKPTTTEPSDTKPQGTEATAVDPHSPANPGSVITALTDMAKRLSQRQRTPRPRVPIRQDPIELARKVIRELIDRGSNELKETTNRD